ncbi:hypothetical protein FB45DRAFT_920292 [Roridomyces roridus]|uniref:Uncharacterized protein n=1 Tax=Roridomyces roridus TaxID=1738132 RepID=A0AAD7BPC8_9AGAR|nr:hypothetical protein FB45DRAFT_920292 [Roridomyces roridus]
MDCRLTRQVLFLSSIYTAASTAPGQQRSSESFRVQFCPRASIPSLLADHWDAKHWMHLSRCVSAPVKAFRILGYADLYLTSD